jgi:hypothetical protein
MTRDPTIQDVPPRNPARAKVVGSLLRPAELRVAVVEHAVSVERELIATGVAAGCRYVQLGLERGLLSGNLGWHS